MHKHLCINFLLLLSLAFLGSCEDQLKDSKEESLSPIGEHLPTYWPLHHFPLKLSISEEFSSEEKIYIQDMAFTWDDSTQGQSEGIFDFAGETFEKSTSHMYDYDDSLIGFYRVAQWPKSLPKHALAVTQIIGIKKGLGKNAFVEIHHADILLNYANFEFSTQYSWGYDFQTVVTHEIGHLLGLGHDYSSVHESVMYPTISSYLENRGPKQRDIETLAQLYDGHSHGCLVQCPSSVSGNNALRNNLVNVGLEKTEPPGKKIIIHRYLLSDGTEEIKTFNDFTF